MTTPIPPHIVEEVADAIVSALAYLAIGNENVALSRNASLVATAAIEAYLRATAES